MFLDEALETFTIEGKTKLAVPSLSGAKLPAFFNPQGKLVRNVSIACYKAFTRSAHGMAFADALAGTGARGIRVAKEIEGISTVFLNDTNSKALKFGKRSAKLNHVSKKCLFSNLEACSFLLSRPGNVGDRFDLVDIDPFGTPSKFVDCAIRAVKDGGMLSLTATDSAVLCGVYPSVAQRKYLGLPLRTDYCHEVGMRLLFGLLAQTAMRLECGIQPLFCHHNMHYFRIYSSVKVGNIHSKENENQMGFIVHCFRCGYRGIIGRGAFFPIHTSRAFAREKSLNFDCPRCNSRSESTTQELAVGGPCWIGNIQSKDFIRKCEKSESSLFNEEELDIPLYYDLTWISQKMSVRTPKISDVLEKLVSMGFPASRTRLNPQAVRSEADIATLRSVVKELAR